jgi:hypothetical protein
MVKIGFQGNVTLAEAYFYIKKHNEDVAKMSKGK